jgi:hypothetical protein
MSPLKGMASVSRSFSRNLSVNVDVNESSGSDWDAESSAAEGGEVLVGFCDNFCYQSNCRCIHLDF